MTIEERLAKFLSKTPEIAEDAFVAPGAFVVGAVKIGSKAGIFPGAILRGDIESIEIGEGSNVQDGVIIHLADDLPVKVGKYVTIGHGAMIHACTIEDGCLIGMRATIIDGAVIGAGSIVGAGALVTKNTIVPPNSLVYGSPAKVIRPLKDAEIGTGRKMAEKYVVVSATLKKKLAAQG